MLVDETEKRIAFAIARWMRTDAGMLIMLGGSKKCGEYAYALANAITRGDWRTHLDKGEAPDCWKEER